MMETAQDICGMTKGPRRHKETRWWNEEVADAVRDHADTRKRGGGTRRLWKQLGIRR